MKRKILSIAAVFLICLTSMFMFSGCGMTDAEKTARYGTLTCGDKKTVAFTVNVDANGWIVGEKNDYIESAGLTFTFTPPKKIEENGKVMNPNSELEGFEGLKFKQFLAKGGSVSGWSSAKTNENQTRTMTFNYAGARCSIEYTVAHQKVAS